MLLVLQNVEELFVLCALPDDSAFIWIRRAIMEVFCIFCDFPLKVISLEMSSSLIKRGCRFVHGACTANHSQYFACLSSQNVYSTPYYFVFE